MSAPWPSSSVRNRDELTDPAVSIPKVPGYLAFPSPINVSSLGRTPFPSNRDAKTCPRCSSRLVGISPQAEHVAARRELLQSFFGPSKAPPRVRGELLVPMVFSFRETVLGIEKPVVAGELVPAGNGATVPDGRTAARPPWWNKGRPINHLRPRLELTSSLPFCLRDPGRFYI